MKNSFIFNGILISLIFISSLNAQQKTRFDLTLQAGYNLINGVQTKSGEKFETKPGIPTIYFETHIYPFKRSDFGKNLGFGPGFGFYHTRTEDTDIGWLWTYSGDETGSLYWWALYFSLKYNLPMSDNFVPYFKVDNGYNFSAVSGNINYPDDRPSSAYSWGGYHMSLSGGIAFAKILNIEVNYSMLNSGVGTDYRYSGYWTYWEERYKTKMITLSFGFCF